MAPKAFPRFADGDVTIRFSSDTEPYVLHSRLLAKQSNFFKEHLSTEGDSKEQLLGGVRQHWEFELRFQTNTSAEELVKANPDITETTETELIRSDGANLEGASEEEEELHDLRMVVIESHKQMFSALYHIRPDFIKLPFEEACYVMGVTGKAAKRYGCEHALKIHLESHLLAYQPQVLLQCNETPGFVLSFAIEVKSGWIFKESAERIIIAHEEDFEEHTSEIKGSSVNDMFTRKRKELRHMLQACEIQLFQIESEPVIRGQSKAVTKPIDWSNLTICFFREWLSKQLKSGKGSGLKGDYVHLYRALACEYQKYAYPFNETDMRSYARNIGIEDNSSAIQMDGQAGRIFKQAAKIVATVLRNTAEHSEGACKDGLALRCISVNDEDLPWKTKDDFGSPEIGPDKGEASG